MSNAAESNLTAAAKDALKLARRVAYILGPSCAAAQALERYEQIKAAGHETHMIYCENTFLVKEPIDAK